MKKCPFCSEEIQDEAIKCKHCGEILQKTPPIEDVEPDTSSPVIGRKRPVLSYICATIGSILFFMFAIVAFAGGRSTEGKVSLGLAIAFFFIAPFVWTLGDIFRNFAHPDWIFASGAMYLAKKKLFWMIGPQIIVVSFFWLFLAFVVFVSVSDKGISQSTTPSTENRTYVGSIDTDKQEVTTNPENTQAQSEYLPPTPPQENPTYVENIEINKQEVPTNPESILSQAKDLKPQQESRKNDELIGKRSQEKRTPQGGVKLPFDADNLIAKTADKDVNKLGDQPNLPRITSIADEPEGAKSQEKRTPQGGIKLPFDADNLIAKTVNKDVNKLSDRLNPPRIASITADGNVIIDQGGDRLSAGMLLDVVKSDKPIIDSDTKESIGSPETPVAVLKLVTVAPNISYATIVSGEASQLSPGLICRIKYIPPEEPQGAKSTVQQTPQGGVKLPFDK